MAEDRTKESIVGRDAAAGEPQPSGQDMLEQLAQTTSESSGGNVSGTAPQSPEFDIIFDPEDSDEEASE